MIPKITTHSYKISVTPQSSKVRFAAYDKNHPPQDSTGEKALQCLQQDFISYGTGTIKGIDILRAVQKQISSQKMNPLSWLFALPSMVLPSAPITPFYVSSRDVLGRLEKAFPRVKFEEDDAMHCFNALHALKKNHLLKLWHWANLFDSGYQFGLTDAGRQALAKEKPQK